MLELKKSPEEHPIHFIIQLNRGIEIIKSFTKSQSKSKKKQMGKLKVREDLKPQRRKD